MTIILGTYTSGDFFKHAAEGDKREAIRMCEGIARAPNCVTASGKICFVSAGTYTNWEGQILADDDKNFRLDLQGKPGNFDVQNVAWATGAVPDLAKAPHWAQWQLQFGSQGKDRITRTKGPTTDYRTKFKDAIGGVMMAINRWVTVDTFAQALQQSFDACQQNGNTFGVVTSDDPYVEPVAVEAVRPQRSVALFRCFSPIKMKGACRQQTDGRPVYVSFATRQLRSANIQVISMAPLRGSGVEHSTYLCPICEDHLFFEQLCDTDAIPSTASKVLVDR